jgi:multiple antibiotic resistance protein
MGLRGKGKLMLSLGAIFTLFFITLGPLKLLGPFSQQTRSLDPRAMRNIAWRAFLIGVVAVLVGGYVGSALAVKWTISAPAILIATGIIFFLVAIDMVLAPYAPTHAQPEPLPEQPMAATLKLTFPLLVTPYGIAALIAAVIATDDPARLSGIYLMLLAVMVLNLLSMLFIRQIMRGPVLLALQVLGAVLGVLQVGLAVQIIIRALQDLHVLVA